MRPCYNCKRFHPEAKPEKGEIGWSPWAIGGCSGEGMQYETTSLDQHPEEKMECEHFSLKCPTITEEQWKQDAKIREVRCCATCRYGYFWGGSDMMNCQSPRAQKIGSAIEERGADVSPGWLCDDYEADPRRMVK
jgi:hypothetical protein